jgi:hypothetical protein
MIILLNTFAERIDVLHINSKEEKKQIVTSSFLVPRFKNLTGVLDN